MRILIASPIPMTAVGGPASVARVLKAEFEKRGDTVTVATLNRLEKMTPPPVRQVLLFFRALLLCFRTDSIILLDPASTGPSFALAGRVTGKRCVLRIGGDALWEAHVERTQEAVLLSEFYETPRRFSLKERLMRNATRTTLALADAIVFTNPWMEHIWMEPYQLQQSKIHIIPNTFARQEPPSDPSGKAFLASGRPMRIKNLSFLQKDVWPRITAEYPDAVLDTEPKSSERYREALAQAYAVILPSLSDVSPNSIHEAIQQGKPFICTRDTGIYELHKERGIFIDTRNADELLNAIRTLLTPEGYADALERVRKPYAPVEPASVAAAFRTLLAI